MAKYLKYELVNLEPLRIADDSISQNGQTTPLSYIPGTTVRGLTVNQLAGKPDFETKWKRLLFSEQVRFLNAYLTVQLPTGQSRELIPSPKGFYENKVVPQEGQAKKVENVTKAGVFTPGNKRAGLGQYCYMDKGCIYYYSVDTGSDMKIKRNVELGEDAQSVFRSTYIRKNQHFTGYIALPETGENTEQLEQEIKAIFREGNTIILGNARTSGMGKCRIIHSQIINELPYGSYGQTGDAAIQGSCYMLLLSNTAMRNAYGENCGIDWEWLEKQLGEDVKIREESSYCATSTVDVRGYNRNWTGAIPSVTMYEKGSVFHIAFTGTVTADGLQRLSQEGIGIRTNEGFGRVLFLRDYESIVCKMPGERAEGEVTVRQDKLSQEDQQTLTIAARGYYRNLLQSGMQEYVLNKPLSVYGSNSQKGNVLALATKYRYEPEKGIKEIRGYLKHAEDKQDGNRVQKERASIAALKERVNKILDEKNSLDSLLELPTQDAERIMGIPRQEIFGAKEEQRHRLELIIILLRYDNKEGVK